MNIDDRAIKILENLLNRVTYLEEAFTMLQQGQGELIKDVMVLKSNDAIFREDIMILKNDSAFLKDGQARQNTILKLLATKQDLDDLRTELMKELRKQRRRNENLEEHTRATDPHKN